MFLVSYCDAGARILLFHFCGDPWSAGCGITGHMDQYKYLLIIIDHKLNWISHVQYVKQRVSKLIYEFTQNCSIKQLIGRFLVNFISSGTLNLLKFLVFLVLHVLSLLTKCLATPCNFIFAIFIIVLLVHSLIFTVPVIANSLKSLPLI